MIKVYSGIKGFAVSLFLIAGIILFFSVFFWGISKAAELFLPLLTVLSYLLIIVFVLGILPASFSRDLRPTLGMYALLMSHGLGVSTWMMSFFYVIKTFGMGAIFVALLFQFLAPIAIIGAIFKGAWVIAGHLLIWISFTYGMRYYHQWLLNLNQRPTGKSRIIDVEVHEVEGH